MAEPCWIVTPIKPLDECKTRLRAVLDDAALRELVKTMFTRVVTAVRNSGAGRHVLIGPAPNGDATMSALVDPGGGLNAALDAARLAATAAGARRLVILPADLPLLTAQDVAALALGAADEVAIAPDRHGAGTNALSLPLPAAGQFRFQFGAASLAAHCTEASRSGLRFRNEASASLCLDIDEREDLELLIGQAHAMGVHQPDFTHRVKSGSAHQK